LKFVKDTSTSAADNDEIAKIEFYHDDDGNNQERYGSIIVSATDVSNGSEDSRIRFNTRAAGADTTTLTLDSGQVGIGTTSPDTRLTIAEARQGNASDTILNQQILHLDDTTAWSSLHADKPSGGGINFSGVYNSSDAQIIFAGIRGLKENNTDGNYDGALVLGTIANGGNMTEKMRIASDGKVFIGSTASRTLSGVTSQIQVEGLDYGTSSMSLIGNTGTDASTAPLLIFGRSRGTSDGTSTAVASGDRLGAIFFTGADGTDINTTSAYIEASVDGSVSGNTMPGRLVFYTNSGGSSASEKMRIASDGTFTFKNTSARFNFYADSTTDIVQYFGGHDTDGDIRIAGSVSVATTAGTNACDGDLIFATATGNTNKERMRVNSTGGVQFHSDNGITAPTGTDAGSGTLAGGAGFFPNSVGRSILYLGTYNYTSAAEIARFTNQNGVVGTISISGTSTSFNTSSDYRLKENQVSISDGLTRLNQLKPYRFNFIADADTTLDGFFAHEVADVVPEAIMGEKDAVDADGNIKAQSIDHSKLVPLLVKAIQELSAKVEALEKD
jgi:hypothetical protein